MTAPGQSSQTVGIDGLDEFWKNNEEPLTTALYYKHVTIVIYDLPCGLYHKHYLVKDLKILSSILT